MPSPRTVEAVWAEIERYENDNSDLPEATRRAMALAVVAPKFPKALMVQALGDIKLTGYKDKSWRWWNVLRLAGLEQYWDGFRLRASQTGGSIWQASRWLRSRVSARKYQLFLRRAGSNPYHSHYKSKGTKVWTKGGTWDRRSNVTRVLVLGEHLGDRHPAVYQMLVPWLEVLEQELHTLTKPDQISRVNCLYNAVNYLYSRSLELLQWRKQDLDRWKLAAWFFMETIRNWHPDGTETLIGKRRLQKWEQ